MSARYEFQINQGGRLEISVGGSVVSVSTPESHTFRAIRQQSADIAELRAELAAAVGERSEYWGALHSTKDELFECRANQRTLESELRITRDQRDTLRADLAAAVGERDAWRRRAEESEPHLTVGAKWQKGL